MNSDRSIHQMSVKVPTILYNILDDLLINAMICVDKMLLDRTKSSTKYYKELPSIVAKGLISKYQKNYKCKKVSNLVLPVYGEKGQVIQIRDGQLRIFRLFRNNLIPIQFRKPPIKYIRYGEFIKRKSDWYFSICYDVNNITNFKPVGTIGIDRNSVGTIATLSDPQNGKVLHLGYNSASVKENIKKRRANLQKKGKRRLLSKLSRKQLRRSKYENHKVSKQIIDYAVEHRRCIVVENLKGLHNSKIKKYVNKSQWAFSELLNFIEYKAALHGVMVLYINPEYTSQECSRCNMLTKPNGKKFRCNSCGHKDHRDANAAFSIAQRVSPIGGFSTEVRESVFGFTG